MRCTVLIWSARLAFVQAMRSLAYREGLEVIGVARSADAAIRCVHLHRPAAVLIDKETEEQHPDAVVRLIVEGAPAKVVAVDLVDEAAIVLEGRRAPAATVRDLVHVIEGGPAHQAA
jgi:DNA-binding NarL/FixJ family response regulator